MTIEITPSIRLADDEIQVEFSRAGGPGGQNVNKVSSAVQLRFDVFRSESLPESVRARLKQMARNRITAQGILIINARRFRTQEQNRQDAVNRLVELIQQAAIRPKHRRQSRPPRSAKENRLKKKQEHSQKKRLRGKPSRYDE